jgi:predicted nucleic acid-binding protein
LIAVDSSVVVAAFASWHELHEPARAALDRGPRVPAQAALEVYSVLTRLPPPHRVRAGLVRDFLAARFPAPYLALAPERFPQFTAEVAEREIVGGAAYDALIAAVARDAGATLLTCDRRAERIYVRIGAAVDYLA